MGWGLTSRAVAGNNHSAQPVTATGRLLPLMPALYIIKNSTSSINYSRGPQAIQQFVNLVSARLRIGLSRRIADRAGQRRHRRAGVANRKACRCRKSHPTFECLRLRDLFILSEVCVATCLTPRTASLSDVTPGFSVF